MHSASNPGPVGRRVEAELEAASADSRIPLSRVHAISAFLLDHPSVLLPLASSFGELRPIFESSIRGPSMHPAIPSRARIRVQLQGGHACRRGDVVFYLGQDGYMVHRVAHRGRGGPGRAFLLTLGDNQIAADPPVREDQVLGTVVAVQTAEGWRCLDRAAAAPFFRRSMRGVALFAMIGASRVSVSAAQRLAGIFWQTECMGRFTVRRLRLTRGSISSVARRVRTRARFEVTPARSASARLLDRARHRDVVDSKIDVARMNALLPAARRMEVARTITEIVGEQDNPGFFRNLGRYGRRYRSVPRGIPELNDVYAPNLAILDFLGGHFARPENEVVLDFPCGIGVLLLYTRLLGFTHTYGFDNWSQLARSTAGRFLHKFGLDESMLVNAEDLASLPVTIVTCVGVPWPSLVQLPDLLAKPSVRYVLLDCPGRRPTLPGFRRTAEYAGLLSIFQKSPE